MSPKPDQQTLGMRGLKDVAKRSLGPSAYRKLRITVLRAEQLAVRLERRVNQAKYLKGANLEGRFTSYQQILWHQVDRGTPVTAFAENFERVGRALDEHNIEWWTVSTDESRRFVVGVRDDSRLAVLAALGACSAHFPVYVTNVDGTNVLVPAARSCYAASLTGANVIRVAAPSMVRGTDLKFGMNYGCDIEFWNVGKTVIEAPRENRAARLLSVRDFELVPTRTTGINTRSPKALTKRMLDDIAFPIDAVYTWVDGDDPDWINSKRRLEAELAGTSYHPEANHAARFRSRDELLYSLRSLEMYASWFRRVFLVTSGQVPEWLNVDHPKLVLVRHEDIYASQEDLPTFNSNSIISRLHHIPELSEHYVYINDDVFFGRLVRPDQFFYPSGIAKVSPSRNRRPFGDPAVADEPHVNLTRNMRALLEQEFGVTISRAIKHTPHPQLKSVHNELESAFPDAYARTWSSRFRHHSDIVADQLHHYYAQLIGKAVPGNLRYNYINVLDDSYRGVMAATLNQRNRDTFCINDAPVEGAHPMSDEEVGVFLEEYFPQKSSFEK